MAVQRCFNVSRRCGLGDNPHQSKHTVCWVRITGSRWTLNPLFKEQIKHSQHRLEPHTSNTRASMHMLKEIAHKNANLIIFSLSCVYSTNLYILLWNAKSYFLVILLCMFYVHNFPFCVPRKKESHRDLEQYEWVNDKEIFFFFYNYSSDTHI